jgi:hypothetical protein
MGDVILNLLPALEASVAMQRSARRAAERSTQTRVHFCALGLVERETVNRLLSLGQPFTVVIDDGSAFRLAHVAEAPP